MRTVLLSRRAVSIVFVALVGVINTAVRGQPAVNAFLLSPGKVGAFQIGDSIDEVYGRVGRDQTKLVDLFKEGLFSPALEVHLSGTSGAPALVADIREWPCDEFSIAGISVRDPRF